ncbi:hypothetical protein DOT_4049 [Desulfosporosinus sp. OT]|nr:hypothetical protein DOT_4049 [Desulfosporosinus sp. OT]
MSCLQYQKNRKKNQKILTSLRTKVVKLRSSNKNKTKNRIKIKKATKKL